MIATVVFFTEKPVLEGMLVSNVGPAVVGEGVREVFARAGAQLKDVELVGSVWCRTEERA